VRRLSSGGLLGLSIILAVTLAAILAPRLSPTAPGALDLASSWRPPGPGHPLGTGDNGVDVLTQLLFGARVSLAVGVSAVLLSGVVGTLLGTVVGQAGGLADEVVMRLIDVLLAFPGLLLAIFITALLGPSFAGLLFALCATSWVSYARLARAQARVLCERDFVTAARALGASPPRILVRHLLPNLAAPILVQATFGLPGTILAEAALSFLGLGVPAGTPSWGALVDQGTPRLLDAPHVALCAGGAIALTVLGFNLAAEALRDRLDPRGAGS
jgi:peptide/nickel transport system permease protein